MQSVRLFVLGLAITGLLTGCANPFLGGNSDVTETYVIEFDDIPIPKDMEIKNGYTEISQTDNLKTGHLRFTGRVEWLSLINACSYNMHQQNWIPIAIFKSPQGLLVFRKDERVCVIVITDSFPNTLMRVWVSPKMNGFTVPPTMPVGPAPVEPEVSSYHGAESQPDIGSYNGAEYQPDDSGASSDYSDSDYSEVYYNNGTGNSNNNEPSNEQNLSE